MKTARLMITNDCFRGCTNCCNNNKTLMKKATELYSLYPMKNYEAICITGGEPLQQPQKVLKVIEVIKAINPKIKIYLYTSMYSVEMINILDLVDGVTYSVHEMSRINDVVNFNKFQILAGRFPDKSLRLYLSPKLRFRIPVKPVVWKRIVSTPWDSLEDCKLPENETLFILKVI
jgi:organic radical activating enzyme